MWCLKFSDDSEDADAIVEALESGGNIMLKSLGLLELQK